jgi:hypothetical protein
MKYFYWGGLDIGKMHLKKNALINDKTIMTWSDYYIKKIGSTTHIFEPFEWYDVTKSVSIYHNNNKLSVCHKDIRQIIYEDLSKGGKNKNYYWTGSLRLPHVSQINPIKNEDINKLSIRNLAWDLKGNTLIITQDQRENLISDKDVKKYSDVKYIDTEIYYEILRKYRNVFQPLTRELLDGQWNDILEGVDCFFCGAGMSDWMLDDLTPFLRESMSIVPIKSNKLDRYISKLDGFQDFRPTINISKTNIFETYERDKELVWKYLDSWDEEIENIVRILDDRKIPYTYFDLDKDSYEEVFKGWNNTLPRDYTHRKNCWQEDNPEFEKNYNKIKAIAEEYLALKGD